MNKVLLAVPVAFALAACGGGISTNSDFDPSVDFGKYGSYTWVDAAGADGAGVSTTGLVDQRIRAAVDANLQAKGLRRTADVAAADLAVSYQLTTKDNVQYNTINSGWGGGYGYYGWGMGMGTSTTYASTYTDGSLIIGLFDTGTKKMVWQGVGTKTLDPDASAEKRTENINEAVAKILADYPPGR